MGKISQVSAKYIIHSDFKIEGVVDKPDIIGAVFGQTEGLLGSDLELRELQRNGRIGRIEVVSESKNGKTIGTIQVPSSLDKAETCIVGAALEIIQRIGPCNALIQVKSIEDVRVSKRDQVVNRAKDLLRLLMDNQMPDSAEIAEEVAHSVRQMEICTYGKDKLPAGPGIEDSDEIIVVEGRADVLNLLKYGFKNVIAINGTSVPQSIADLCRQKTTTVFVDGDRGGELIIRELASVTEIDFVTRAPDGKEVEEITKKEINKALRAKIAYEQAKEDLKETTRSQNNNRLDTRNNNRNDSKDKRKPRYTRDREPRQREDRDREPRRSSAPSIGADEKKAFKKIADDLVGSHAAVLLDEKLNVLGKVPNKELANTIKNLPGVHAALVDGEIDKDTVQAAEKAGTKFLIGSDAKVKGMSTTVMKMSDL